jgi:3-oxochol-4-en-24-oyl-CoA dehydrogenase
MGAVLSSGTEGNGAQLRRGEPAPARRVDTPLLAGAKPYFWSMPLALTEEHRQLAVVAREFALRHGTVQLAQRILEEPDQAADGLWDALREPGLLSLHIPEEYGGQGYGLPELAVVVEEFGRAILPGSFLPTCMASAAIAALADAELAKRWLPGLGDGSLKGAVGTSKWALGGATADVFVLVDGDDVVIAGSDELTVETHANLDLTRRTVEVTVRAGVERVREGRTTATSVWRALAAAEASGLAHGCTEMAVEYAKVRQQFGRPIGSFMAVKHHCANMKVQAELATAAAWDAAGSAPGTREGELAAAVATAVALPAAIFCAQTNIQVHGGIGYTWEHPAHLFLRRAGALAGLVGPVLAAQVDVYRLTDAGVTRTTAIDLPAPAEEYRADVRAFLAGLTGDEAERRASLVDSGYLVPHWPKPWGRSAGPVEQLVVDEEFDRAGVERPDLGIGGWVTLTFTQHGSDEQVARWTRPSLLGETQWCQLFSEPNAGSDAAGIQTRGTRTDGGWLVNGQKLWTSGAQFCTHGFATVRTDPAAPKHQGVTMMAFDLKSEGVTIRPLRSIAGHSGFNEVFFDDVFVPDGDVVGEVNGGWAVARATLGNERVTIGSGRVTARDIDPAVLLRLSREKPEVTAAAAPQIGAVIAEGDAMHLMNVRSVLRAVIGAEPSPEGNIAKLLNSEHGQRVADLAMALSGADGVAVDLADSVPQQWVSVRGLSIAGGTSEIGRNQIGERLLGLPREPGLR